jgi:hypothetical protein
MSEIITFPGRSPNRRTKQNWTERRKNRKSMRQFLFRCYNMIAQSDDADLIRDVCLDMHKAEVKPRQLKEALRATREHSAARIAMLTEADAKLSVPRSSLLCSRPGGRDEAPAPIDQEAQPAADSDSCKAAEVITTRARAR